MAFMYFLQHNRESGIEESFLFPNSKNISKTEYHENGAVKSMGQYRGKYKDGIWQYWDSSGNEVKTEVYDYGKLVETKKANDG